MIKRGPFRGETWGEVAYGLFWLLLIGAMVIAAVFFPPPPTHETKWQREQAAEDYNSLSHSGFTGDP